MSKKRKGVLPHPSGPPTIHEAALGSGASGAVVYGAEIDLATSPPAARRG